MLTKSLLKFLTFEERSRLQIAASSPVVYIFCRHYAKDGSTIPVGECTKKDFTQSDDKPPCYKKPCAPSEVPMGRPIPRECISDAPKGPCYDPECRRPYVNPCVRDYKPCFPSHTLIKYQVQPCGRPNLMDTCPVPNCPYVTKNELTKLQKLGLLLAALAFGGFVYKVVDIVKPKGEPTGPPVRPKKRKTKRPQNIVKVPAGSDEIPDEIKYLIIGGGPAGHSAFKAIRNIDEDAHVLVVSNEPYFPYMRPPLCKQMIADDDRERAKALKFRISPNSPKDETIFLEPSDYYVSCCDINSQAGVAVARGWTVMKIDASKKKVVLDGGKSIKYDKCLVATGSYPRNLPVFEDAEEEVKERVTLFRTIFDFQELDDIIDTGATTIAVVGGGFLGSEIACSLKQRKPSMDVIQIIKDKTLMNNILPPYMSEYLTRNVLEQGVKIKSESNVDVAKVVKNRLYLDLDNGCTVDCDQVIVAVGVEPNTDFADNSALETCCDLGGYLVNTEMEMRKDLYAAGDCACYYDLSVGRRRAEHHRNAVLTGQIAGKNMAGEPAVAIDQAHYGSGLGKAIGYEAVGLVSSKMPTVGVFTSSEKVDTTSGADPPPNGLYEKGVIFYFKDDVIVGMLFWNIFGKSEIARMILKAKKRYEDVDNVAKVFVSPK